MEANYWHNKWEQNDIGFHQAEANPLLVKHLSALELSKGERVFLPLCGKTLDIGWLLFNGYRVVGAELSELAVVQLFEQIELEPMITEIGYVKRYSAQNIDIFVGDIFKITRVMMGKVDAIFDRAALVALPEDMRKLYTKHLIDITQNAPQLLITFEYDTSGVSGPPHAILEREIAAYYENSYQLITLERAILTGGIKGKPDAIEHVWQLRKPI